YVNVAPRLKAGATAVSPPDGGFIPPAGAPAPHRTKGLCASVVNASGHGSFPPTHGDPEIEESGITHHAAAAHAGGRRDAAGLAVRAEGVPRLFDVRHPRPRAAAHC